MANSQTLTRLQSEAASLPRTRISATTLWNTRCGIPLDRRGTALSLRCTTRMPSEPAWYSMSPAETHSKSASSGLRSWTRRPELISELWSWETKSTSTTTRYQGMKPTSTLAAWVFNISKWARSKTSESMSYSRTLRRSCLKSPQTKNRTRWRRSKSTNRSRSSPRVGAAELFTRLRITRHT